MVLDLHNVSRNHECMMVGTIDIQSMLGTKKNFHQMGTAGSLNHRM